MSVESAALGTTALLPPSVPTPPTAQQVIVAPLVTTVLLGRVARCSAHLATSVMQQATWTLLTAPSALLVSGDESEGDELGSA